MRYGLYNGKQVIKKFVPQKDRQAIVYAVDFPDVIVDKGEFFGQSNPQPLRLFIGGQFWNGEKMLVQNMIALKVTKDDNIEGGKTWTMNPKSSLYKMALGAKLIETGKAFNPSRIVFANKQGSYMSYQERVKAVKDIGLV